MAGQFSSSPESPESGESQRWAEQPRHRFEYPMLTRHWETQRELWEEKVPMTGEEIEVALQMMRDQLEGLKIRQREVQAALGEAEAGSENAAVSQSELQELNEQITGIEEDLETQVERREMYVVRLRDFRRYTLAEAADAAEQIRKEIKEAAERGVELTYRDAEKNASKRFVEELLEEGNGWHAIQIAVESAIMNDDIALRALWGIEDRIAEAEESGNAGELRRLRVELRSIGEWRGVAG